MSIDLAHIWRPVHVRFVADPFACPLPDSKNDNLAKQREAVLYCRQIVRLQNFLQTMEHLMLCLFAVDEARKERGRSPIDGTNIFVENVDLVTDYVYLSRIYLRYCLVSIRPAVVVNNATLEGNQLSRDVNPITDSLAAINI